MWSIIFLSCPFGLKLIPEDTLDRAEVEKCKRESISANSEKQSARKK